MQVSLRHSYYNASGNLCPDFAVTPTQESIDLMASLGLLFQQEGTGFSVLLDRNQGRNVASGHSSCRVLSYLRAQSRRPSLPEGAWTRLSFTLATKNSMFVNFTSMPIGTSASTGAYYLSNAAVKQSASGEYYLHRGPLKKGTLPLTGPQYPVILQDRAIRQVVAKDVSGKVVICQPAYWWSTTPAGACASPPFDLPAGNGHCCPGPTPDEPGVIWRNPIYLDFSGLPEGKYAIDECDDPEDCQPAHSRPEVLYVYSAPSPMFFIDLFFAQPPGVSTGVYPIDPAAGTITPTQYFLDFTHRSTTWNYYIVSTGMPLTDLRIEAASSAPHSVSFTGPSTVTLPNGQRASHFVSDERIALEEQPACRFQLKGKAGGVKTKDGVLMNRLPVASAQQVIPRQPDYATSSTNGSGQSSTSLKNYSDIYVYI